MLTRCHLEPGGSARALLARAPLGKVFADALVHDAHSATGTGERHWSAAPEAGHWAPECQPAGWHRPAPGTPVKLITRH